MPPTYASLDSIEAIKAEIATIDARIKGDDASITFFQKQLYGAPAVLLYTEDQIEENPPLAADQREIFPAVVGATQRDLAYQRILFPSLQAIIDSYENERVLLDGQYPDFTIAAPFGPGSPPIPPIPGRPFDENCVEQSGGNRVSPLFNPAVSVMTLDNPGQMFGGSFSAATTEISEITIELAKITILLSGACQIGPPIPPVPCQAAKAPLIASLKARFDSTGPSGILLQEEAALNSNPDLPLFTSNPLAAIAAEKARITAFITAINAVPLNTAIPPATLTANQIAVTARQSYLTGTRIPEMNGFLNTTPGYYNTRFQTLRFRVEGSGTLQQVNYLQQSIVNTNAEKTELYTQRAFLVSLLPPV
jgi:hypothetical protein